jgi:hypothetical protein
VGLLEGNSLRVRGELLAQRREALLLARDMRLRASAEKRLAFGADCSMGFARSSALCRGHRARVIAVSTNRARPCGDRISSSHQIRAPSQLAPGTAISAFKSILTKLVETSILGDLTSPST